MHTFCAAQRYPGIVGGRHNDILAAELLEELRIVFLLCCMRTAENLLKKERERESKFEETSQRR